jgi:Phosphoesterase family
VSRDGRFLYVAENLGDALAVIDLASGAVRERHATQRYPYDVVVAPDGRAYVSAWGGTTVSVFAPTETGVREEGRIDAGRHPSALQLNGDGSRLFVASGSSDRVAVVDTRSRAVVARLMDPPPAGPGEGSTPNALALSTDGTRLYVAEADANAIAVFDLSRTASNVAAARGDDRLAGRIPTQWYPTAVAAMDDRLWVVNGKGHGSAPNPGLPQPTGTRARGRRGDQYTLGQLHGTMSLSNTARATGDELRRLTERVAHANGWNAGRTGRSAQYPPFRHVLYVIKENRTYDQVFGDLAHADGDTSLLYFGRDAGPNHHALAERFGVFDRFFVNAEVSADGHNWSTGAYASDYVEKTVQSNYSGRGRTYDYEGTNRDSVVDDDVNEGSSGYLWTLAEHAGISFRNYGEFAVPDNDSAGHPRWKGVKPYLRAHTSPTFPAWDLDIRDQARADAYIAELHGFEQSGDMPALEIMHLPNDHTSGAAAGKPTPRAYFADNDLALGRMIEALSRSRFWGSTVVFVLEDDAQNGPDHVDSHRSPLLVISAYNHTGTIHRFANTTDVLRTIEEILGLSSLSQFDYYGRPLRDIWSATPDLTPYQALTPAVALNEMNPANTTGSRNSARLDFRKEDLANEDAFNRVLWSAIKGDASPYPGARRASMLELRR